MPLESAQLLKSDGWAVSGLLSTRLLLPDFFAAYPRVLIDRSRAAA